MAEEDFYSLLILGAAAIAALIYFLPTIAAFSRQHPNRWIIFALNLCFGLTGIVWLGTLIWAFRAIHIPPDAQGSHGGESGLNLLVNDYKRVRLEPDFSTIALQPRKAQDDAIERLERLKKLLDDGVISTEQFHQMRDRIVNG